MCELGIRWPNKNEDAKWWSRYTIKTSKDKPDMLKNCGKRGFPSCPEEEFPYGDQDCGMIKAATVHMKEDEANAFFCTNAIGHSVFDREAPHIWVELDPIKKWYNNEYHCGKWLEKNGVKALQAVSNRTIIEAEAGVMEKMVGPNKIFGPADIMAYMGNSTSPTTPMGPDGNFTMEIGNGSMQVPEEVVAPPEGARGDKPSHKSSDENQPGP